MKRWVLILIILALVAGSFFVGRWTKPATVPADYSSLKEGIVSLTAGKKSLEDQLTLANQAKETLSAEITSLKAENTTLETQLAEAKKNPSVDEPEKNIVYNDFGQLGGFYRNVDEEVIGYHEKGAVMQYSCKNGEIGVYLSIDKSNTVMSEANENEVVAYIPCPSDGSSITSTTIHWSGTFQRAHWVAVYDSFPVTSLEGLMLLQAQEQNRPALLFAVDGKMTLYPSK